MELEAGSMQKFLVSRLSLDENNAFL